MTADFHVRDIQALGGYVDRAVQWVSDVRGAAAAAMQRLDLIRQNGRMAVRKIECDVEEIEEELEGVESELASLDYESDCLYEDTDGQRRASLQCEINRVRARRREVQAKLSERKSDLRRAQGCLTSMEAYCERGLSLLSDLQSGTSGAVDTSVAFVRRYMLFLQDASRVR